MSDEEQKPRDTVLLPDGIVLRAQLVVQCATQLAEASDEHPEGLFCGNVIEAAADITFEPGLVAEMAIECPACSKRISASMGQDVKALIPIALLIGEQVEEAIPVEPAEGESVDTCPTCGAEVDAGAGEGGDVDEEEEGAPIVELSPEDQGATDD